ncbi:diguanylate cyclase [Rheinheimera muenzenbergensis]|uniref:diguanylate cyclase n=1 Tax=Rheinheimera muenzenbergensis TaxID=1193628 RepID=A0ABU8C9T9_9GAMM
MSLVLPFCRYLTLTLLLLALPLSAQSARDTELEAALDAYVLLSAEDTQTADQQLLELERRYADSPAISSRVRLLSYLVNYQFYHQSPEQLEQRLQHLLAQADLTEDADTLAEIYATELEIRMYQVRLNDAFMHIERAQQYARKAISPRVRYYANNVLGRLYKADNQFEQALQHYILALDAVSETDDAFTLRRRAFLNFNIAHVHTDLRNWQQAKSLTEQMIAEAKKYQHDNFLPELYLLLGYIAGSEKDYPQAISVNKQGLAVALADKQQGMALTFENNLGATYIELQQYDEAKVILQQALQRAEQLQDEYSIQLIKQNLGFIRVMQGEPDAGIEQMQISMRYLSQNSPKAAYEPYYEWLAKAYAAAGRYKEQADTLLEQMALQADIRKADSEQRLAVLQDRFDSKAKAQHITILEQENALKAQLLQNQRLQQQLVWLVVVIVAFAAILLLQLYRKVRRSNKKLFETNKQLAYQSQRDVLTGLYNRRALQEYLQKRALKRREGDNVNNSKTGFLLLDVDFFKRINDNFGHAAGDAVLQVVAQRLQDTCRDKDIVVRWGGEEILLVLDNVEPANATTLVQRVLDTVAGSPVSFDGQQITVTVSGGFIHLPFAGVSETQLGWEKVLQIADMALYLSKTHGRNQCCVVEGLHVSFAEAESQLYSDLTGAIRAGHVKVATISGPGGNVS